MRQYSDGLSDNTCCRQNDEYESDYKSQPVNNLICDFLASLPTVSHIRNRTIQNNIDESVQYSDIYRYVENSKDPFQQQQRSRYYQCDITKHVKNIVL